MFATPSVATPSVATPSVEKQLLQSVPSCRYNWTRYSMDGVNPVPLLVSSHLANSLGQHIGSEVGHKLSIFRSHSFVFCYNGAKLLFCGAKSFIGQFVCALLQELCVLL